MQAPVEAVVSRQPTRMLQLLTVFFSTQDLFVRFVVLLFVAVSVRRVVAACPLGLAAEGQPFVRPGPCLGRHLT